MTVYTDINTLPAFSNAVVTIGTFDGVHLGHCQIIRQLKDEAERINGKTVIITFHPHPRKIVGSGRSAIFLINTPAEKIQLLEEQGIDYLVIVPFTKVFAEMSASAYVEDFLIRHFHPHTLIIGYDHRFGKGREGDFRLLEEYAQKTGFRLIEISPHLLHQSAISSTRIREAVSNGKVDEANELLGYSYFFEGVVIEGNKLGRTIGFPTANLRINDKEKLVPGNGVYAVIIEVLSNRFNGNQFLGMMNIGVRPTVDGINRVIEVNIFDFDESIYGEVVKVHLKKYLRSEQKFTGIPALTEQLTKDREQALDILSTQAS